MTALSAPNGAKTKDPIYGAWIQAANALGLPVTDDYNGSQTIGFSKGQYTIRNGRRSSSANAFLKPASLSSKLDRAYLRPGHKNSSERYKSSWG